MRKDTDPKTVHGHDVGRGCCTREAGSRCCDELLVVVRDQDTNAERAEHEESGQTVEYSLESLGHDNTRIFSFTGSHTDVIRSSNGERGLDETLEEAEEVAKIAAVVEWCESALEKRHSQHVCQGYVINAEVTYRVVPVSETKSVAEWITAQHDDERENDET